MLDSSIKEQLKAYLEKLKFPIELVASYDTRPESAELKRLLADIASCSDKVQLKEAPAEYSPSFGVALVGEEPRVRFAGLPLGHEFTSLILALLQTGGHPPKISVEEAQQVIGLPGGLAFETFISLSCHNCPDVVQALNTMAILNPGVTSTMVDGALFQDLVAERQILAVPTTVLNGAPFSSGRMSLDEVLAKVDTGAAERNSKALTEKAPFDVLVVGGGPAGSAAAIYAARKGIRTGLVAERFGGQVMDTLSIENFISVKETEGPQLTKALEEHVKSYDVDVMPRQRAAQLISAAKSESGLVEVKLESGAVLSAQAVILATGAKWRELNVPGEQEYKAKGVCFCPHCDGPLFKGKRVAVIGGGNSGVEAAIDLAGIVDHVTLLEYGMTLKADAVLQRKLESLPNVTVLTRAKTTEVVGDGEKVTGLRYVALDSGAEKKLELAGLFVQIGLVPSTSWLRGAVDLTPHGEIVVDAKGATTQEGVFAAGDCTVAPFKQIIIAMGAGSNAALGAFDHLIRKTPALS